MMKPW